MSQPQSLYRLLITAESDSTSIARISGMLASLNLVPEHLQAHRSVAGATHVIIATIAIYATPRQIDILERKFRQMTLVLRVELEQS